MKFDRQQKIAVSGMAAIFILFIGALLYFHLDANDSNKVTSPIFSTSTPEIDLSSNDGWWTSIPTDPSLPTMPAIHLFKSPPTATSTCTTNITVTPKESK